MNKNFISVFFLMLAMSVSAMAQSYEEDLAFFKERVKTLGSDEFGGRKPLTEYETKTIHYIADEFKKLGLQPANGDSYFQPVKEISTFTRPVKDKITVKCAKGSMDLKFSDDIVVWTNRGTEKVVIPTTDYVFCGFGINAPEYGWKVCQASHVQTNIALCSETMNAEALGMKGWLSEEACKKMFALSGLNFGETIAAAKKPGFKSFTMKAKSKVILNVKMTVGESHNVAAVLPGTDLKDEYLVFTAHWDHFGIGTPIDGDSIYNGASDNASGVATLMLLAKKYQSLPVRPRRSIVFVAVTSEECGLLGSQYYCEHPLFPLSKTAINLNFDGTAPRERTHDVSLRAAGKTDTDALVIAMAAAQGRTVKVITEDPAGGYFRSDHFNFVKKGVPTILVGGGKDYVDKARHEAKPKVYRYHQPNDEYDESWWDFDGAMEDMNLMFSIGLVIANNDEMPKWTKEADFQRQ